MSAPKVYTIAEFSNDKYRFDIVDNPSCSDTWLNIFEKYRENGAIGIINLGYFGLSGGGYASGCKIHGEWMFQQTYDGYGICIDENGNAFVGTGKEENAYSYSEAVPAFLVNGESMNRDQTWTANGTTTLGFKDGNLVCMLCDKDNGQSTAEQISAMEEYGCQTILRMDGSWSSHGRLGMGKVCQPSQMRKDRSYLIIYDRNYVAPRTTKKVTLDPYGTATSEAMFAICDEIKEALEKVEGIECMISRFRDNPSLSSSLRADQSDCWKADLVYSVLIGESSNTGKGVCCAWTSKETSTAYKFAASIRDLMKEANIPVADEISVMATDPILKETYACAAMAAFVGDYSTKELRRTAVEVSVKAICNKFGVEYIDIGSIYDEPTDEPPVEDTNTSSEDVYGEYDEETRKRFKEYVDAGIIPTGVTMGQVIRYGDIIGILDKVSVGSGTPPAISIDYNSEEFKTAVTNIANEILNNGIVSKEEIADIISKSIDESLKNNLVSKDDISDMIAEATKGFVTTESLGKEVDGINSTILDNNIALYNAASSFTGCIEKGLGIAIEKAEGSTTTEESVAEEN